MTLEEKAERFEKIQNIYRAWARTEKQIMEELTGNWENASNMHEEENIKRFYSLRDFYMREINSLVSTSADFPYETSNQFMR